VGEEKKKLRTKDLREDFFEEIKSNDDLDISLTISKSSSSVSQAPAEQTLFDAAVTEVDKIQNENSKTEDKKEEVDVVVVKKTEEVKDEDI
jgi:hypothetical protein